ncbi:MAG: DNA repair protein RadC [Chloroflexi bacterium]|nr:DNA repair protein RadC [Chloroflexota bacterium]
MPDHLTIADFPDDQRPRERLLANGASALSNAELLAILLRTGTPDENVLRLAERLLAHYNGLHGLAQAAPADLQQFKGLGAAKIAQMLAALELGKRLMTAPPEQRPLIRSAADAAHLLLDMSHLPQEHVRVMLLDSQRRVVTISTVYIGTLNATVLRVSEIFREAVTRNIPAIILAHNHPVGDAHPSPEDIDLTRTLIAAGQLLDIAVLDHLIFGQHGWSSLRELGLAFKD